MAYITTKDGARIFYKDWGPRDAQPIVFHHGWPLSADDWDNQMMFFLAQGYRVIAHDRRGHGRSDQTDGGNEMDTYAADVDRVLEVERARKLHDIRGIGVHVVAGIGLTGTAVAPPVVGDDAEALVAKEQQLIVPIVRAERPSVMENNRLRAARTPVFVEDLGPVSGRNEWHGKCLSDGLGGRPAGPALLCREKADGECCAVRRTRIGLGRGDPSTLQP